MIIKWFTPLQRVIKYSGRKPQMFYQGVLLRIAERIFDLLPFFIAYLWFSYIYQHLNGMTQQQLIISLVVVIISLVVVLIVQLLASYYGYLKSFVGSYHIIAGYRERIIDQIHAMPLGEIQNQQVGELTEVVTSDVKKLEGIFTHSVADILSASCASLVMFMVLACYNWQLALALIIPLPVAVIILEKVKKYFLIQSKQKQQLFAQISGLLVEFIMGIRTLRLFNKSELWLNKLNQQFIKLKDSNLQVEAFGGGAVMLFRLLVEFGLVALLVVMAYLITAKQITPLDWLLFILIAHKLLQPLLTLPESITIFRYAIESETRLQQMLDTPLLKEPQTPKQVSDFTIALENVSFRYEVKPILQDISFTVPQGTLTAIVGPSGSGKTTLLNVLARFYEPQQGTINIGGVAIGDIGTEGLYQCLSIVFQQVLLHQGSILENVAIGNPTASQQQIEQACKAAYCDSFINNLEHGYQTAIGETGSGLSGGERQRISIARALLKDAPILLLDEVTASVDPIAQYEIQQALSKLAQGRTVVMIAHRLNTIRYAEQIIVLDQGRIVGCGKHDDLLQHNQLYQQLWQAQSINH